MRLRTFTAPDMNRAMLLIRETMGDDAVIISTARDPDGRHVSVTAALEEEIAAENSAAAYNEWPAEEQEQTEIPDFGGSGLGNYLAAAAQAKGRQKPAAKAKASAEEQHAPYAYKVETGTGGKQPLMSHDALLKNRELAYFLNELEQLLHFHSVPLSLTEKMMRAARHLDVPFESSPRGVAHALTELLSRLFRFAPFALDEKRADERLMLIGPSGVGKTLAAAKFTAHRVADRLPVQVLTIDNKRAGGVEQLQAFTAIMGTEVAVATSRSELRHCLKTSLQGVPMVIDSFGTNPYSFKELKELTDFANLHAVEPVLVLAAGTDTQEVCDIVKAFGFLNVKRLLVTRVDCTRRLGAALAAADAGELAFGGITTSAQVAGGLQALTAAGLAQKLMQYKFDDHG